MISVVANIFAAQGKAELIKSILQDLIPPTRAEAGCLRYDLFENVDLSGEFTFIEDWESRDALEAHLETDHFINSGTRQHGNLAKPTEIKVLNLVNI